MVSSADLIEKVVVYVKEYMSNFDCSHDFHHIERVVGVSHALLAEISSSSSSSPASRPLDKTLITLAALLHDVGDRKYLKPGQDANTMVRDLLIELGADDVLAAKVQTVCLAVSYTSEVKDPGYVTALIETYPELAIVQDADRLDAIGAVGIGRVFSYGAAKTNREMGESVGHFEEKLFKVVDLLKTDPGKRMGIERTEKLRTFRKWWDEEMSVNDAGIAWV